MFLRDLTDIPSRHRRMSGDGEDPPGRRRPPGGDGGGRKPSPFMTPRPLKTLAFWLMMTVLVLVAVNVYHWSRPQERKLMYSQLHHEVAARAKAGQSKAGQRAVRIQGVVTTTEGQGRLVIPDLRGKTLPLVIGHVGRVGAEEVDLFHGRWIPIVGPDHQAISVALQVPFGPWQGIP